MKTLIYPIFSALIVCSSCNGQTHKDKKSETETTKIHTDGLGQPKVDINVNKRYDKKGNLISYDSTYTSYYSSKKRDKILMDSLFKEFKPIFNEKYPLMNDKNFNTLFFNDSLLYNDFFHDDFFIKRFELNEKYMSRMMQQMDSVKNEFFKIKSKEMKK